MRKENPFIHDLVGTHDEAHELFKCDPEEFERRCRLMIKECIDGASEQNKQAMTRIQHEVDKSIRKIKNPIERANVTFSAMCNKLNELNSVLQSFSKDFKAVMSDTETAVDSSPKLTLVKKD